MFVMNIWFGLPLLVLAILSRFKSSLRSLEILNNLISGCFAKSFAKMFSKFSRYYCLIEFLPKYAEDVTACNLMTDTKPNEYAIVLQGPVLDGFTAETVRIYRKIFPKAVIIVSTWKSTEAELVAELRSLADEVILSDLPSTSGLVNINYQAKSSYEGMKRAHELGIPYAFKTRSDNRIYAPLSFEYCKSLLEAFPVDESVAKFQKERIITLGFSIISKPYWLPDLGYFGTTEDLMKFFDLPQDMRHNNGMTTPVWVNYISKCSEKLNRKISICSAPEVRFTKSYLHRASDKDSGLTLKDAWDVYRKRFISLSWADFRLFLNKYDHYINNARTGMGWKIDGQPDSDANFLFINTLAFSLLKGHLICEPRLEENYSNVVEVFPELGKFCKGYEHLEEVMSAIPILRGEIKN